MRRILLLVIFVLVVGLVGAGVFTVRSNLVSDRDAVDEAWEPLADYVGAQADRIALLAEAVAETSDTDREVVDEARAAVVLWWEAVEASEPTSVQVTIANDLEGLAARLETTVTASSRLSADEYVVSSLAALREAVIPAGFVDAYNGAVEDYDDRRNSFLGQPVASLLGFEAGVTFVPAQSPSPPTPDEVDPAGQATEGAVG